jgi:Leucine-rich repeat (LRR) protein
MLIPGVHNMESLKVLILSHNVLTAVPAGVGKLDKLNTLQMSYNQLSKLSTDLGHTTGLTQLLIDHNELTEMPVEMGRLTNLTDLALEGNFWTKPPTVIIDQGCDVIVEYLGRLLEARATRLLFMDNMKLPFLPPEMLDMPYLTGLSMADNQVCMPKTQTQTQTHTETRMETQTEMHAKRALTTALRYSNETC